MSLAGRYFSERDLAFITGINNELLGDIVQTVARLFKPCADVTDTNIYGERNPKVGKTYYPGIDVVCLIDRAEISTDADDFGPNRKQNVVFKFMERDLQKINFFPQAGDIIGFNERYHEVDDVVQEQLLGGQSDKSFSIVVNTHYSRLSNVDIVERQS